MWVGQSLLLKINGIIYIYAENSSKSLIYYEVIIIIFICIIFNNFLIVDSHFKNKWNTS